MQFEIAEKDWKQAQLPHEIFLANLIGNHILMFIGSLGIVRSLWQPLALVPVISFCLLFYILWRARISKQKDNWFVMCHWQIAAQRSRIFIYMLLLMLAMAIFGWLGYTYLGMKDVAVYAIMGGAGLLPTMVTVLVLIILESDAMYQAKQGKLPESVVARYPNPGVRIVEERD